MPTQGAALGSTAFFFGTFNPVHCGHLALIQSAQRAFGFTQVVVIPAGQSPWKAEDPDMASVAHRLAMVRIATEGLPGVVVDDVECFREGPSYTADTLDMLPERYPQLGFHQRIPLMMGSDALAGLARWHRFQSLISRCVFVQAARPGSETVVAVAGAEGVFPIVTVPLPMQETPISASEVRQRVSEGLSLDGWVTGLVAGYIAENRLWR